MSLFTNPNTVSDDFMKALKKVHESKIEPNPENVVQENMVNLPGGGQSTLAGARVAADYHREQAELHARAGNHSVSQMHHEQHAALMHAIARHHEDMDLKNYLTAAAYPDGKPSSTTPQSDGVRSNIPPFRDVRVTEDAKAMPSAIGNGDVANPIIVDPKTGMSPKVQLQKPGLNQKFTNRQ